jgi:hypothetical protein
MTKRILLREKPEVLWKICVLRTFGQPRESAIQTPATGKF